MNPNVQIIQPTEILDGTTTENLQKAIDQALAAEADFILVDCERLTFMDSSGLGALVLALKKSRLQGCRLCLCTINRQVDLLFSLTDTHQVFEIYADQTAFEAAIATE
ncbi:MAG: STAS domain-containing protein [Thermosynechococcaceae cyanobacterium]